MSERLRDRDDGKPGCVSDQFVEWAHEAVTDWDGQDDADLLELIAERFGIGLGDLVQAGKDRIDDRNAEEFDCPDDYPAFDAGQLFG